MYRPGKVLLKPLLERISWPDYRKREFHVELNSQIWEKMNNHETSLTVIMSTKPFRICWNYFCWHLTFPIQTNPTMLLPNFQIRLILVTTSSYGSAFSFLTCWLFKSKINHKAIKLTSVTREADRLNHTHSQTTVIHNAKHVNGNKSKKDRHDFAKKKKKNF